MTEAAVDQHDSDLSEARCIDGFMEVFFYEDGSISMAIDGMPDDAVEIIISALQAGLERKSANIH